MVGYPFGKKAWRLYDLDTEQFFTCRDVRFQEDVFPFATIENYTPSVVPSGPLPGDLFLDAPTNVPDPVPSAAEDATPSTPKQLVHPPFLAPSCDIDSTPSLSSDSPQIDHMPLVESPSSPGLPELLGKGLCTKKPSVLLKDYVVTRNVHSPSHVLSPDLSTKESSSTVSGKVLYPIADCLHESGFSANHIAFLAAILDSNEPKHFKDAVLIKEWCDAMQKEIDALDANQTWEVTDLPPGKKAISSKWV
ncbi:PREDICTED: uncharacterized protein LOC104748665 [Camelina sativa]|uniref:Uncharacterized protein LOC104748665 n=1 Tax=Camelina sativa TaxID=90675 RepID=A0ABM0WBE6_CAMSA|nr:PREDICTED: uncharacterized protein LOC104748665 [Camelina sativa]